jgi:hypothetical protein
MGDSRSCILAQGDCADVERLLKADGASKAKLETLYGCPVAIEQ